ncbi:hypothetical protein C7G43_32425 [Bradyrhizobium sp. MOS004]|nr:hypothetical protein C7G43_32425 [Bradyrhizobium sp. MOS004]HAQ81313.1 hypothetical protein [Bradyrhizobium sp.]HAR15812.1 hypothetical protein [Bradyrhizobium sp.]HAR28385.1 hypothetical protein [Bradyrhizobium sp.]HBY32076.1 hypothetical protein [Bradyrhizobium sp.]
MISSFRGGAERRTRNPFIHRICGPMDSGLALRAPRNDTGSYVATDPSPAASIRNAAANSARV